MANDIDQPPLYDPLVLETLNHMNYIWVDWFATFYQTLISYISQFGFFVPILTTTQRNSIQDPQNAQFIFNSTINALQYYDSAAKAWKTLTAGGGIDLATFVTEAPEPSLPNSFVLTAGSGITITPTPGIITISSTTGGFTWNEVTTATQTIAVNNGYITNRGAGVTYTLPFASNVGDEFSIVGKDGIWSIAQLAGQTIQIGKDTTTMGIGGSITADDKSDCVSFVCITANTAWSVTDGPQTSGFIIV